VRAAGPRRGRRLADKEGADFLASLAELLRAGADIRTALGILSARFERPAVKVLSQALSEDISGGESLDRAFGRGFSGRHAFVAPMVAAGEAAGDLPGALQRTAEVIYARLKLRDQMVSVLAYPGFVFLSAIAAVLVILLFIVPSVAPLATEMGGKPPPALAFMIAASNFLQAYGQALAAGGLGGLLILAGLARLGALSAPLERLFLDGPARRTVTGLVFGGFAMSLGTMLAAGAPISDALRLATRATPSKAARRRLEPVAEAVREGQTLSDALAQVRGFPGAVVRLAAVGEASNAVGQLLIRGGKLEEDAALKRIETVGRVAGPALIVLLGGILGVLMGSLLSGVSQMGQAALG
jgi:type II secretory pathway component PulF